MNQDVVRHPASKVLVALLAVSVYAVAGAASAQPGAKEPAQPNQNPKPAAPVTKAPAATPSEPAKDAKPAEKDAAMVLKYTVKSIDGKDVNLADYTGKVVMIVNVASKCGLTKQYAALEKLYEDKKDGGLVILGFPANNFGSQEPGTNEEIKSFCTGQYNVTFPMFSKISVKGDDQHALYKQICALPEPLGGEVTWNFAKVLVDRTGKVVARFDPKTTPDDPRLVAKVDELLAQPAKSTPPAKPVEPKK